MKKEESQFVIMSSSTYKLLFVMASTLILNIFPDN